MEQLISWENRAVVRTRVPLHRDERLPWPDPSELLRILDHVIGRLLFSGRGLQLRAIRVLVRDLRIQLIDRARERVLLDRHARERRSEHQSAEQQRVLAVIELQYLVVGGEVDQQCTGGAEAAAGGARDVAY